MFVPALGMVCADPLVTLVDTAVVGHVSRVQLGALGPCASVFGLVFLSSGFVGVATTGAVARARGRAGGAGAQRRADEAVSDGLCVALAVGAAWGLALVALAEPLAAACGAAGPLLEPAAAYTRVRALGAPAMAATLAMQGASLGEQDAATPLRAAAGAGALNAALDLALAPGLGVAGAAWATAASQWAGAAWYLARLRGAAGPGGRGRGPAVRAVWRGWPDRRRLAGFGAVGAALVSRNLFVVASYAAMTAVAAGQGVLAVATHQVARAVFWVLSGAAEPLGLATQSLVARDAGSPGRVAVLSRTALAAAAPLGAALALALAAVMTLAPGLFTADPAVRAGVRALAPQAAAGTVMCALLSVLDGLNVATRRMGHVPWMNLAALLGTSAYLGGVVAAGGGLGHVWWGLLVFYGIRAGINATHFLTSPRGENPFAAPDEWDALA